MEMRSASLLYAAEAIKKKWQKSNTNKDIDNGKKSVTARYLQLKSGHAITGIYLLRIKKAQSARC
jgi:plasmid replication initiation protein